MSARMPTRKWISSSKGANYGWNRMEGTHCFNPDDPNKHPETCDKTV